MSKVNYEYSFQTNPIILVGGVAGTGAIPIGSILNAQNYPRGITGPADPAAKEFAHFRPVPGHTLMVNEVAEYPFANQSVAANAVIASPLSVSLEMVAPATAFMNASNKLSMITNLKSKLDQHTALGGWYIVATPSFIYTGCLLTSLVDATSGDDGSQVQVRWIWNFTRPLITDSQLQAAQNQYMAKISNQTQNVAAPASPEGFVAQASDPYANIVQNFIPAARDALGSNVAPVNIKDSPVATPTIGQVFGF
jgi:hypothetical protein